MGGQAIVIKYFFFACLPKVEDRGSARSCASSIPGMLSTTIVARDVRAIYLKTHINPFSATKRLTFWPLVRYIHLNPLRAGVVKTMKELDAYPWSGHRMIIAEEEYPWMDRALFLGQFGGIKGEAIRESVCRGGARGRA